MKKHATYVFSPYKVLLSFTKTWCSELHTVQVNLTGYRCCGRQEEASHTDLANKECLSLGLAGANGGRFESKLFIWEIVPENTSRGGIEWDMKGQATDKGLGIKSVTPVGTWSFILVGNSGKFSYLICEVRKVCMCWWSSVEGCCWKGRACIPSTSGLVGRIGRDAVTGAESQPPPHKGKRGVDSADSACCRVLRMGDAALWQGEWASLWGLSLADQND